MDVMLEQALPWRKAWFPCGQTAPWVAQVLSDGVLGIVTVGT